MTFAIFLAWGLERRALRILSLLWRVYRRRLNAAKAVGPQVQSLRDEETEIRKAVAGLRSR